MNLKNDERKIQLKISLIEGDIIKEFLIEVLPYYTIKQVKGFIDSTQNIGSENYVLMKLTDELTDDTIADHIRRTKKDSKNTIHLTARSLVKKSEIKIEKDIESKEDFSDICSNPESNDSEVDGSDTSSFPNLFNAMKKCDNIKKYNAEKKMLKEKRRRIRICEEDDESGHAKIDIEGPLFGDDIVEDRYNKNKQKKFFGFKEETIKTGGEDYRREQILKYFDPHVIEYQEHKIIIQSISYEEMIRKLRAKNISKNVRKALQKNNGNLKRNSDYNYRSSSYNNILKKQPQYKSNYKSDIDASNTKYYNDSYIKGSNFSQNKRNFNQDNLLVNNAKIKKEENYNSSSYLTNSLSSEIKKQNHIKEEPCKEKNKFSYIQSMYNKNISDDKEPSEESESDIDQDNIKYESVSDLMMKILDIEDETLESEKQKRMEINNGMLEFLQEIRSKDIGYNNLDKKVEESKEYGSKESVIPDESIVILNDPGGILEENEEILNINSFDIKKEYAKVIKENNEKIIEEKKKDSCEFGKGIIDTIPEEEVKISIIGGDTNFNNKSFNDNADLKIVEEPFKEKIYNFNTKFKLDKDLPLEKSLDYFKTNQASNNLNNYFSRTKDPHNHKNDNTNESQMEIDEISFSKEIAKSDTDKPSINDKLINKDNDDNLKKHENCQSFNQNKSIKMNKNPSDTKEFQNKLSIVIIKNHSEVIQNLNEKEIHHDKINRNSKNNKNIQSDAFKEIRYQNNHNEDIINYNTHNSFSMNYSPKYSLNDIFGKVKSSFDNIIRTRFGNKFNCAKIPDLFLIEYNKLIDHLKGMPLDIAFNYSSGKKINMVLDIDNTFLYAETLKDQKTMDFMYKYAKERNIKRYLMNLSYKGRELQMSFIFRKFVKEFFVKFDKYTNFLINSKGLDVYSQKVAQFVNEEFKVSIPNSRIQGRIEIEKGKSLKHFSDYRNNESDFVNNCIIIDDKPENWEGFMPNVISSHKFISFSTERLTHDNVKEKYYEMFPFNFHIKYNNKDELIKFLKPEVYYSDVEPIIVEYENSFNHQFKYLNEMFEIIYKISMITNCKFFYLLS